MEDHLTENVLAYLWTLFCSIAVCLSSYNPTILLLGIYPEELKSDSQRHICTTMFVATLFPKKQSECSISNGWIKKMWHVYRHIERKITQPLKGYTAIYDSTYEPGRHFTKWNKPVTEVQILYDSTNMRYLI